MLTVKTCCAVRKNCACPNSIYEYIVYSQHAQLGGKLFVYLSKANCLCFNNNAHDLYVALGPIVFRPGFNTARLFSRTALNKFDRCPFPARLSCVRLTLSRYEEFTVVISLIYLRGRKFAWKFCKFLFP